MKARTEQGQADLEVLSILPAFRCCARAVKAGVVTQEMIDTERQQVEQMRLDAAKETDGSLRRKAYDGWIVCAEKRLDGAQKALGMKT